MDGSPSKGACDDLLREVGDLLHGELDEERARALRAHLDTCPPCLETADFQAHLRELVAKRCGESVPDDLKARISAMLSVEVTDSVGPSGSP